MGVTSRSTSGRTNTNSNSQILTMKQVLYAAVIIAFFATSAKANTKCWSCMKVDENNVTRPWACGQDGATQLEETCGDRVIGCVSEHVKHRKSTENGGTGEWEEFRMKHCLDPQRPRPESWWKPCWPLGRIPGIWPSPTLSWSAAAWNTTPWRTEVETPTTRSTSASATETSATRKTASALQAKIAAEAASPPSAHSPPSPPPRQSTWRRFRRPIGQMSFQRECLVKFQLE